MSDSVILTGIKPTGTPHLGNYVGALKPLVEQAKTNKTLVFVADLHALNTIHNPEKIRQHTYEITATLLALGLDLNNAILFRQSDIAQVYQLATLLMNVTPKGLMNRAHSYKAMVDKNTTTGQDVDIGVNMGLYTYPILMSADILLYGADKIPVGADQKQHVEFARDIAEYFNRTYGTIFKLPEPIIDNTTGVILGIDGRKMSKSYNNTIPLFASTTEMKKSIMRIVTDSKQPDEPKDPDTSTIFQLYRQVASEEETLSFRSSFASGGMGYGTAKKVLFEKIESVIGPCRTKYEELLANREELDNVLTDGALRAGNIANDVLSRVKQAMLG